MITTTPVQTSSVDYTTTPFIPTSVAPIMTTQPDSTPIITTLPSTSLFSLESSNSYTNEEPILINKTISPTVSSTSGPVSLTNAPVSSTNAPVSSKNIFSDVSSFFTDTDSSSGLSSGKFTGSTSGKFTGPTSDPMAGQTILLANTSTARPTALQGMSRTNRFGDSTARPNSLQEGGLVGKPTALQAKGLGGSTNRSNALQERGLGGSNSAERGQAADRGAKNLSSGNSVGSSSDKSYGADPGFSPSTLTLTPVSTSTPAFSTTSPASTMYPVLTTTPSLTMGSITTSVRQTSRPVLRTLESVPRTLEPGVVRSKQLKVEPTPVLQKKREVESSYPGLLVDFVSYLSKK